MEFRLKKDSQIIAAAHDFPEVDTVFSKPGIIPVHIHGAQLVKQVEEEPGGACLPVMTMADVGNSHRLI